MAPLFPRFATEDQILSTTLRQVLRLADKALARLAPTFCRFSPEGGRLSITPAKLLLVLLLQTLFRPPLRAVAHRSPDCSLLFQC